MFGIKDLIALRQITKLIDINVSSLKIEGRMKSMHYIATVVNVYRRLIDTYYKNPNLVNEELYQRFEKELEKAENRETASGFLTNQTTDDQIFYENSEQPTQEFIAFVLDYDKESKIATIQQRNYFKNNILAEVFSPDEENREFIIDGLTDIDNNPIEIARHGKQTLKIKMPFDIKIPCIIRRVDNR